MYDSIPSKASIVNNDVYLPSTEICRLLHQLIDVLRIQHITGDSCGLSSSVNYSFSDCIGFPWPFRGQLALNIRQYNRQAEAGRLASVNILHNNLCTLFSEQTCCFSANPLPTTSYDSDLKQSVGESRKRD